MVSMVMPETGLRAVVAMALAATEVKKKENSSVSARPASDDRQATVSVPKNTADGRARSATTPDAGCAIIGMSRSVRSRPRPRRCRKARAATANEPATMRRDLRMPKMPAVAMAPTPMKRT